MSQASWHQECQVRAPPRPPELCPQGLPTTPLWASVSLSVKWAGEIRTKDFPLMLPGARQGLLIIVIYVQLPLKILFIIKVLWPEMV